MFAGIDCARDWPQAGMSTARWLRIPPRPVPLDALTATQDGVFLAPLINPGPPVSGDPCVHVRVWRGVAYLEDGHTRAVRAALNGQSQIAARVLVLDGRRAA